MFDLLTKLFEIAVAPVDVEKKVRSYYKKVLNTKLVRSTWPGEEDYLKFWLLTTGDVVPVSSSHARSAADADTDHKALAKHGAYAGAILDDELSLGGRKKFTQKQISALRNLYIEYKFDKLVVDAKRVLSVDADIGSSKELAYYLEYGKEEWESKNRSAEGIL